MEAERVRGLRLNDFQYWQRGVYFFELVVPTEVLADESPQSSIVQDKNLQYTSFIYPLLLNPEQIEITDKFEHELSIGHDGGVFVEENGVVLRSLRIKGTFGQKRKYVYARPAPIKLKNMSFDYRAQLKFAADNYSGLRLFQFLQDNVFRAYGDLKRNYGLAQKEIAENTQLYFHDTRNREHWLIVPASFTDTRNAHRTAIEEYTIQATIIDRAHVRGGIRKTSQRPKNIFDQISDAVKAVRAVINKIKGFVRTVNAVINVVKQTVANVVSLVSDATNLVNALGNLLNTPFAAATALTDAISSSARSFLTEVDEATLLLSENVTATGDIIVAQFRSVKDAAELLLLTLTSVGSDNPRNERDRLRRTTIGNSRTSTELARSSLVTGLTSQGLSSYGSGPLPGEQERAAGELFQAPTTQNYSNVRSYVLQEGDTLESVARLALGDASRARQIADLNGLRYPYITTYGAPNTVRPGQTISLPGTVGSAALSQIPGVFTSPNDEPDLRICGADWKRTDSSHIGFQQLEINGDRDDAQVVSGLDNMAQAVALRMETRKGTSSLFPDLGMEDVITLPVGAVTASLTELRLREAIEADPRVATVTAESLTEDTAGTVVSMNLVANLVSLNRTLSLTAPVGAASLTGA